jgi:AhpD family alkylhydroperoxidase
MEQRINIMEKGQEATKAIFGLGGYLMKTPVEKALLELVYFRISQINGCAYCMDMHSKDARAAGETEQRLYSLSAWRETPYYSDRERAALAWAEAVNKYEVSDDVYNTAKAQFTDEELIDLTVAVSTLTIWNRLNIAFQVTPGGYKVGQF